MHMSRRAKLLRLKERCSTNSVPGQWVAVSDPVIDRGTFRGRSGLTILELLVSITLITVLLAIIVPSVQAAREAARRVQCSNNLKQIGLAMHLSSEQESRLPAGWSHLPSSTTAWSWGVRILPFVDQAPLYQQIQFSSPIESEANRAVRSTELALMRCPSDNSPVMFTLYAEEEEDEVTDRVAALTIQNPAGLVDLPASNYVGIFGDADPDAVDGRSGTGTFLEERSIGWQDLRQGLSNVMIVSERTARKLPASWLGIRTDGEDAPARLTGFARLGPNHIASDECELDSRHRGFINAVFADGHVTQLADAIDQHVYRQMARREP